MILFSSRFGLDRFHSRKTNQQWYIYLGRYSNVLNQEFCQQGAVVVVIVW